MPSYGTVLSWLYRKSAPEVCSPIIKALRYPEAYRLALELKRRNPQWGTAKLRTELHRRLGIWVPRSTIYHWVVTGRRPALYINVCQKLALALGYLVEKGFNHESRRVEFKTTHREIVRAFKAIGGIQFRREDGRYLIRTEHSALLHLLRTKLWVVIRLLWPEEFERGRELAKLAKKPKEVGSCLLYTSPSPRDRG